MRRSESDLAPAHIPWLSFFALTRPTRMRRKPVFRRQAVGLRPCAARPNDDVIRRKNGQYRLGA
jgi:hypothetical protein